MDTFLHLSCADCSEHAVQLGEAEREAEASHIQVKALEQALAQRGVASHVEGVQSPMSQEQTQGTGMLRLTSSVLGEALTSASSGSENEKNWSPVTVIHADGSGMGSPDRVRGKYFGSLESDSPAPGEMYISQKICCLKGHTLVFPPFPLIIGVCCFTFPVTTFRRCLFI
jgi:hypothetical protein